MARAIFEYSKLILEKVSFDKNIFKKELIKAYKNMLPSERDELLIWLKNLTAKKPELADMHLVLINI